MNYEKIILELMGRIQTLEETTEALDGRLRDLEWSGEAKGVEMNISNELDSITRNQARERTMEQIRKLDPDFIVEKAARLKGGGILVHKPDGSTQIIRYSHSKPHSRSADNSIKFGWYTVAIDEIMDGIYHLCLFSLVDASGKWHYFMFTPDELGMYNETHRSTTSDTLHLYFSVQGDKAFEMREEKNDVTAHYNNWSAIAGGSI
jgi:hypothetical protein